MFPSPLTPHLHQNNQEFPSEYSVHIVEFSSTTAIRFTEHLPQNIRPSFDKFNISSAWLSSIVIVEASILRPLSLSSLEYSDGEVLTLQSEPSPLQQLRVFTIMPGDFIIKVDCYTDFETSKVYNLVFQTFFGIVFSCRIGDYEPHRHQLMRYSFQNQYQQFYALQSIAISSSGVFVFSFRDHIPYQTPLTASSIHLQASVLSCSSVQRQPVPPSTIPVEQDQLSSIYPGLLPHQPFTVSPTIDSVVHNNSSVASARSPQLLIPQHVFDRDILKQIKLTSLSTLSLHLQPVTQTFPFSFSSKLLSHASIPSQLHINGRSEWELEPAALNIERLHKCSPPPDLNDVSTVECRSGAGLTILHKHGRNCPNYIILGIKHDYVEEVTPSIVHRLASLHPPCAAPKQPQLHLPIRGASSLISPLPNVPQPFILPKPHYMQLNVDFDLPSASSLSSLSSLSLALTATTSTTAPFSTPTRTIPKQNFYPRISAFGFQYLNHRTDVISAQSLVLTLPLIPEDPQQFFASEQTDKLEIIPIPQSFILNTTYPLSTNKTHSDRHKMERLTGMIVWAGKYINGIQFIYAPYSVVVHSTSPNNSRTIDFHPQSSLSQVYGSDIGTCRPIFFPPDLELSGMMGYYSKRANFITNLTPTFNWHPILYPLFSNQIRVLSRLPFFRGHFPLWFFNPFILSTSLPDLPVTPGSYPILRLNAKYAYLTANFLPYLMTAPFGPCAITIGVNEALNEIQYITFVYHNSPPIRFGASPSIFQNNYETVSIPLISDTDATPTEVTRQSAREVGLALTQTSYSSISHHTFKLDPHFHLVSARCNYLSVEKQPPYLCGISFLTQQSFSASASGTWSEVYGYDSPQPPVYVRLNDTLSDDFMSLIVGAEAIVSATRLEHLIFAFSNPTQSSSLTSAHQQVEKSIFSTRSSSQTASQFLSNYIDLLGP